ncbi:unconventional prefoldin RPB5 interactor 1 [Chanos chanos]|uniref:Protein phosphatase 1 regulatory subunit 19 n=1 Tax=Chanos chanos TaxID=29144 RepID=A0A6J2WN47_CHACN|nr:unconventional prefoldin RPB5 interactor 1 [Chanos chanos]XP_030645969.1 unconventional prefoldin RPB5 interactor 1 [Chanos chanos]
MSGSVKMKNDLPHGVERLTEEHRQVVKNYQGQIEHWNKVERDYEVLQDRLKTLPDRLSYDIMVPFGPLAFMPGKLVHTNEVTVLLGDNWFAQCSAKEAQTLVEHRKKHVQKTLDDLHKVVKNFENRVEFTEDLKKLTGANGDYVDIREEMENDEQVTKGKQRLAHKPHSKPKEEYVLELEEGDGGGHRGLLSEEELWARLDELERLEEEQDEQDRVSDSVDTNGEYSSSSSSEEEKEGEGGDGAPVNGLAETEGGQPVAHVGQVNGISGSHPNENEEEEDEEEEEEEEEESNALPTIYFSHTVEPKKVRINTGKNTTLKFSERKEQKEQAKRKKKNGKTNGHSIHEHHKINTPADIYRLFVDVVNGELIPRKSILKSRSRENSVCSDTSESSAADFEERRVAFGRTFSHDDATHSDTSDGVTEEESPTGVPLHPSSRFEAFSGTVVEKDPLPSSIPHLTIAPPALPTIPERKLEEVGQEVAQEPPKRVSKFKAARLQQK